MPTTLAVHVGSREANLILLVLDMFIDGITVIVLTALSISPIVLR